MAAPSAERDARPTFDSGPANPRLVMLLLYLALLARSLRALVEVPASRPDVRVAQRVSGVLETSVENTKTGSPADDTPAIVVESGWIGHVECGLLSVAMTDRQTHDHVARGLFVLHAT